MTQKELLYFEDAIGHEKNIIAVCRDTINRLTDENLINFMESEVSKHEETQNKLMKLLEEKTNE